jgi:hypothetical protein
MRNIRTRNLFLPGLSLEEWPSAHFRRHPFSFRSSELLHAGKGLHQPSSQDNDYYETTIGFQRHFRRRMKTKNEWI